MSTTLKRRLMRHGRTGLYCTEDPCGCVIDDLAPCGEYDPYYCRPGWRHDCARCPRMVENTCPFGCERRGCTSNTPTYPKPREGGER